MALVHQELDKWAYDLELEFKTTAGNRSQISRKHMALIKARDRIYNIQQSHYSFTYIERLCFDRMACNPPKPPPTRLIKDGIIPQKCIKEGI
jgi:hypothetical protein